MSRRPLNTPTESLEEQQTPDIVAEALRYVHKNQGYKIKDGAGHYSSPRISSEIMDCSMPMTFDHLSSCSLGCTYCVPAGTKVLMANGYEKTIERINPNEYVSSLNLDTGQFEAALVHHKMRRKAEALLRIELEDGSILELTPEHPVLTHHLWAGDQWIEAGELQEGQEVLKW